MWTPGHGRLDSESFGNDLGLAHSESAIDGTAARQLPGGMGIATGPVALIPTAAAHGGDALPAKPIHGDTVSAACRMEQMGRARAGS